MKLAKIKQVDAAASVLALVCDQTVMPLPSSEGWPDTMEQLLERFDQFRDRLQALADGEAKRVNELPLEDVGFDSPLRQPEKIICIGKNYADHAKEMGSEAPALPIIFSKFASSIIGPEEPVLLPELSRQVDFEAELVVVIGVQGKSIAREDAMKHVFGYCCGNDISARDWQKGKPGGQWLLGKTMDSFAPLGPVIVTADEVPDPQDMRVQLRLNGQTMQDASTADMIFPIDRLISHVSNFVTLKPGDLIFTGTPPGVGAARTPPVFLSDGDKVEVQIESVGCLSNPVMAANR